MAWEVRFNPYSPIEVDGKNYRFDGNVKKNGERLRRYLDNPHGFDFVVRSIAYAKGAAVVADYVGVYVHEDDRSSETYRAWWAATIQPIDERP